MKRSSRNKDIWEAIINKQGQTFTVKDLAAQVKAPVRSVYNYTKLLKDNGFIASTGASLYCQKIKQLEVPKFKRDGTVAGEDARQTLWRTMLMLKDFDIAHLVRSASLENIEIKADYARIYADDLANVGILRKLKAGKIPSYKLVNNLGGKAPIVKRIKVVFDPNSGKTFEMEQTDD